MLRYWMLVLCFSVSFSGLATEKKPVEAEKPTAAIDLTALQQAWQAQPQALATALPLAQAYLEQAQLTEDEAYFKKTREVLQAWWEQTDVPAKLRLIRAQLHLQQLHLSAALADVQNLSASDLTPLDYQQNLLLQAQIQRMHGNYDKARELCIDLGRRTSATIRALCLSRTLSLIGRQEHAYVLLNDMAYDSIAISPRHYQWVRTEMAIINQRFGQVKKARENFKFAFEQPSPNHYLWRHYGDFLLSQGESKQLLQELPKDSQDAEVQLRRLFAMQVQQQDTAALQQQLATQFQQAQQAGDQSLLVAEARFNLQVLKQAEQALALAQRAWAIFKTPELAEVYLRAALAAQQPQAAQDVLNWMKKYQWQDLALVELQEKFQNQ